jgi:ketosteroid isomerase-like protein
MSTEELVKRLLELVKEGKNVQAEEELYADDVLSVEQNGYNVRGKEAVIEKTKTAFAGIETFHGGGVEAAYVGSESFLLVFRMDVTYKGSERKERVEYGFYKVKEGKVAEEYFYAEPLAV